MPDAKLEPVVVDTGPILALSMIDLFRLLKEFYHPVYIADAVEKEVLYGGFGAAGYKEVTESEWLVKGKLISPLPPLLSMELDAGEAETIALAKELGVTKVVIDESIGRQIAVCLDLSPTGTIGILLRAKANGYIEKISPLLDTLINKGFWLSKSLYDLTLVQAKEA